MVDVYALPEAVLLALGRVAWGAINLEDRAKASCELVLRQGDTRIPINTHIGQAVKTIAAWERNPELDRAISWLSNASSVLQTRNQVLHSVPAARFPSLQDNVLVYFPKLEKETGFRGAAIETPLTVEALVAIAEQIEKALGFWRDIALSLHRARESQGD